MRFPTAPRLLICAALLALAGCHPLRSLRNIGGSCHDPKPYMTARSIDPLRVPAGLDAADTANALKIPRLSDPLPPPRSGKDPCLDEPPTFTTPKAPNPQARSIMRPVSVGPLPA